MNYHFSNWPYCDRPRDRTLKGIVKIISLNFGRPVLRLRLPISPVGLIFCTPGRIRTFIEGLRTPLAYPLANRGLVPCVRVELTLDGSKPPVLSIELTGLVGLDGFEPSPSSLRGKYSAS